MGRPKNSYYRPMPLDFLILERIPLKGQLGGIHWQGRRVKDLRAELLETEGIEDPTILPTALVQSRLRSMHVEGLVENFVGSTGGSGAVIWARTEAGTEHLAKRGEILGEG